MKEKRCRPCLHGLHVGCEGCECGLCAEVKRKVPISERGDK